MTGVWKQLELTPAQPSQEEFILPTMMMNCVAGSSSWRALHLHLSSRSRIRMSGGRRPRNESETMHNLWKIGASDKYLRKVDPGTAERFRVHKHDTSKKITHVYRVAIKPTGKQGWIPVTEELS
jgi:hypothetical protein